jgi:anti-sigma factor RsiW
MAKARSTRRAPKGDCRAQLTELFAYLDGELSTRRCLAIERHLATCTCCDALAGGLRRAIALCRAAGGERLPAAIRSRARLRVRQLLAAAEPSRRSRKRGAGSRVTR